MRPVLLVGSLPLEDTVEGLIRARDESAFGRIADDPRPDATPLTGVPRRSS